MTPSTQEIVDLLEHLGCSYAFYFKQEGKPPYFQANAAEFVSASLIKVPILLAWLSLERRGAVSREELCSLDDEPTVHGAGFARHFQARSLPYADVLLMMIATSDNLCSNLVIRRAGMEDLNREFKALGLEGCRLQRRLMDFSARQRGLDNWISPQDCVRLYELIDGLEEGQRAFVDTCLLANTDNGLLKRDLVRDSLRLCHKTGSVTGVLHDWGYTPCCKVFLLTNGVKGEPAAFEAFGKAGKLLVEND